ncbi:heterokaryon incompatibility protein-domain-containing protein [Rhexocercosporidium sp. MPI-PUGE-AT-0058]|nr:heterokaryon incompatibility protein-domain-containing protein [Rhexocercosporidium sp. MPI-PUGE-AT-0058]
MADAINNAAGRNSSEVIERLLYLSLDGARREIRVLILEPGSRGASIVCSTKTVSLEGSLEYMALSYVWGDALHPGLVEFNGRKNFPITRNLEIALQHLRHETEVLVLWVDALCINQNNDEEKMHQVQLMKEIYSGAKETCLWLGEAADGSDVAMDIVGAMNSEDVYDPANTLSTADLSALAALQGRTWWRRIWVVQELILSKTPIMRCGDKILLVTAFERLSTLYHRIRKAMAGGRQNHLVIFPLNPFSPILSDLAYWRARTRLHDGGTLLPFMMQMTDELESSDPRDKIYGLLGMCPRCDTLAIIPDYSKSVAEVFAQVTTHSISQWANLVPLQAYHDIKRSIHNLPLWVPDYSGRNLRPPRYHSFVFPPHLNYSTGLKKCGRKPNTITYALSSTSYEIVLKGIYFDTVEFSSQCPVLTEYEGLDPAMRLRNSKERTHKIQQAQSESGSRSEAFWRTLMADRMSYHEGHGLPSSAIYQEYFEVWMGRAPVPEEFKLLNGNLSPDVTNELFTKPLTDAIIPKCHGRSFIVTSRGSIGLAPSHTNVGDVVAVLEGGNVPFILHHREVQKMENNLEYYSFVGESYIHGIMAGEAICAAKDEDIRFFKLK